MYKIKNSKVIEVKYISSTKNFVGQKLLLNRLNLGFGRSKYFWALSFHYQQPILTKYLWESTVEKKVKFIRLVAKIKFKLFKFVG